MFYIRCASLERADLFEGNDITKNGVKRIFGATASGRDFYLPHEVFIVPKANVDELRKIITEHEEEMRKMNDKSDIRGAQLRDSIDMSFQNRARRFVAKNCQPVEGWEKSLDDCRPTILPKG